MISLAAIAQIGLLFSTPTLLASIIILGFLNRNEKIYAHTTFLLTFTMIYNMYLKFLWQIPLPAHMDGWAFPSGHMHIAVIFWGYLAYAYKNFIFSTLVIFILSLAGYALVYEGYHYPVDILGSLLVGGFSLFCYAYLQKMTFFKEKDYRLGLLLTLLGTLLIIIMPEAARKAHVWQGWGILMGFSLGWASWAKYKEVYFSYRQQICLWALVSIGMGAIYYFAQRLPLSHKTLIFTQFFMIALWVSSSKLVTAKLLKKV